MELEMMIWLNYLIGTPPCNGQIPRHIAGCTFPCMWRHHHMWNRSGSHRGKHPRRTLACSQPLQFHNSNNLLGTTQKTKPQTIQTYYIVLPWPNYTLVSF